MRRTKVSLRMFYIALGLILLNCPPSATSTLKDAIVGEYEYLERELYYEIPDNGGENIFEDVQLKGKLVLKSNGTFDEVTVDKDGREYRSSGTYKVDLSDNTLEFRHKDSTKEKYEFYYSLRGGVFYLETTIPYTTQVSAKDKKSWSEKEREIASHLIYRFTLKKTA